MTLCAKKMPEELTSKTWKNATGCIASLRIAPHNGLPEDSVQESYVCN